MIHMHEYDKTDPYSIEKNMLKDLLEELLQMSVKQMLKAIYL